MQNFYHDIIKEICLELGIDCAFFSKDWVIELKKDGKLKFISGYKMDTTGHGFGTLVDDKYAMYDVLSHHNIPIIKHHILYYENNTNDYAIGLNNYAYLKDLFYQYNSNIVIKTNNGSCGLGVYHITDEETLKSLYQRLGKTHRSLSVCPYYDIKNEFRSIVVDGKVELIYKKIRAEVVGDGISTISELLKKFNPFYFKDYENDTILKKDEVFLYDWRFNLSRGAISSIDVSDSDKQILLSIAYDIVHKFQLSFGSIDIIKTKEDEFLLMEINSGVMMDNFIIQHENGRDVAKEIYKKAIKKMFHLNL